MPSLMAMLGLNASAFKSGLGQASAFARTQGAHIGHSLAHGIGHHLAAFASVAVLEQLAHQTISYGAHIQDLSNRLSIGTDAVQQWDFALKQNGSSIDSAAGFFEKLAVNRKKALNGNDEALASFNKLGVSLNDLRNNRLEDIGATIAKAFEAGDAQSLIADLRQVGGKGAGELAAAFSNGFTEIANGAKAAGAVIDEHTIESLKQAEDRMVSLWAQFRTAIAPAVASLANGLQSLWQNSNKSVRGIVGFLTGGFAGAKDLIQEYENDLEESHQAEKARADERKKKRGEALDLEESDPKGEKEAEKHLREVKRMKEELARLQRENDLDALTNAQRLVALDKERAEKIKALKNAKTEDARLQAAIDIEKIDKEKHAIKADKKVDVHRGEIQVNELQRIGAYTSANADTAILNVNNKMERHLFDIRQALIRQQVTGGPQF